MTARRWIAVGAAIVAAIVAYVALSRRDAPPAPRDAPAVAAHDRAWAKALRDRTGGSIAGHVTFVLASAATGSGSNAVGSTSATGSTGPTALVCALAEAEPSCVTTGADGAYAIELAPGNYDLWASAPGYAGVHRKESVHVVTGRVDAIDFTLAKGGTRITGVVIDAVRKPLVDATVMVGARRSEIASTVRSGADGTFEAWVPTADNIVIASADGYVNAEASTEGEPVELVMIVESTIAGIVIDARTRAPIADATVDVAGGSPVRSGPDGSFRLVKLEPGRYKPHANYLGGYGEASESVRVGLGQRAEGVTIELHPVAVVVGKIAIDNVGPCPEEKGDVSISRYGSSAYYRAKTTIDGAVILEGVVPGTYEVNVHCDGWLGQTPYPDLVVGDSDVDDVTWSVRKGERVTGRVVDPAGAGVSEAIVNYLSAGGTAAGSVKTIADGTFAIDGVATGNVDVYAYADGFAHDREHVPVMAPGSITLTLHRGGSITGTVVDERGDAVRDARVRASGPDSSSQYTNARGEFTMTEITPGAYDVEVDTNWPSSGPVDPNAKAVAKVEMGKTASVKLVAMSRTGTITGTVVDANGQAVDDALVDVAREDDAIDADADETRIAWRYEPVRVSPNGSFAVTTLPKGTFAVRARRDGAGEVIVRRVAIGASVRLEIRPTGVLAGVVTGAITDDVTIAAEDRMHDLAREERLFHTGGKFALREMPAGTYRITVDGDVRSAITVTLREGERREDLKLAAQPRYVVRGRLVRDGRPLVGWKIEAPKLASEENYGSGRKIIVFSTELAITNSDGRWLVRDLPAGELELSAGDVASTGDPVPFKTITLAGSQTLVDLGDVQVAATAGK